jgi:gliding motility-associated lipoprotein GldD
LFFFAGISQSCRNNYTPRPYGFFRVTISEPEYSFISSPYLPYRFEKSQIAEIKLRESPDEIYWIDIVYTTLNATIHGSYIRINNNLYELTEDARNLAYAHVSRADDLREPFFYHPEKSVYGFLYYIRGNVASPIKFFVTDSVRHFFRGALYFNHRPNKDSIAPMLDYIREDIIHLMETFEWLE